MGLTTAGTMRPVRLAPWFRFEHAIQQGKASLKHGANCISSHIGDFAQAQIAGPMLSLSIGGVLVCRGALRHQARERAGSTQDHEQNQRNNKAERQAHDPGYDDVADDQDNFVGLLDGRVKTVTQPAPQSGLHHQDGKSLEVGSRFRTHIRDDHWNASMTQSTLACPLL
jgi:hypothetical protein